MTITVLIADDHKILREGLRSLLQGEPDIEIVGEAHSGREAVNGARTLRPDVVIMDIALPDLSGIEATREIRADAPEASVIALSMHSDRRFVRGMLAAGACGYLLKDSAFEELALAIRTVMQGEVYLGLGITGVVVDELVGEPPADEAPLTTRETEVLRLLASGKNTAEIARQLQVSVKTIETHRRQIMHKLDLRSVAELTKYAIREGLASL
ncbi:MAG: response regulator [Acidiferrobacterales bacterium]